MNRSPAWPWTRREIGRMRLELICDALQVGFLAVFSLARASWSPRSSRHERTVNVLDLPCALWSRISLETSCVRMYLHPAPRSLAVSEGALVAGRLAQLLQHLSRRDALLETVPLRNWRSRRMHPSAAARVRFHRRFQSRRIIISAASSARRACWLRTHLGASEGVWKAERGNGSLR